MRILSKSKLLAYRQCPKRLWLELHLPKVSATSAQAEAQFAIGNAVGKLAQSLYAPKGNGVLFAPEKEGYDAVITRTAELLATPRPLFEAGFAAGGARAYADILLPVRRKGGLAWRMVEVKSSAEVKDTYRDDVAIQAFVARGAGLPLESIALAHIDSQWVYPGGGDYQGLLKEVDLTEEAFGREDEVKEWIAGAQAIDNKRKEPKIDIGSQCEEPYPCRFLDYCQSGHPVAEYPVAWLPKKGKSLKALIEEQCLTDMREVPDDRLNAQQHRVKTHTLAGTVHFDAAAAKAALAPHKPPAYFLDFETINLAIPIWKGVRPFQQSPFQFSLHRLSRTGKLGHQDFLDLSGKDPSRACAEALIAACGERGPVFAYSAGFESRVIGDMAARFPRLARPLLAIQSRLVDLLPIARDHYYHPDQQGSWSIKAVLPTLSDLDYGRLDEVQDGTKAMEVYEKAITRGTTADEKAKIDRQLRAYCALDTEAMIHVWRHFSGQAG